ncbi:MAG: acetyltransferase [Pyrinomonadaceae bacterium]|nr:acetyltransferase [Phycisphaerales bacterium]
MSLPLILIGGGGHALVVADAALTLGFTIVGFFDDDAKAVLSGGKPSAPWLGTLADTTPDKLAAIAKRTGEYSFAAWMFALGHLGVRRQLLTQQLAALASQSVTVIHPTAFVSRSAKIGNGVYVGPHAVVHTRAVVKHHAIINTGSIVEHECVIGENSHVAPGSVLGGRTRVGADTLIGIGTRTLPGIVIGTGCTIGAGAVLIREVPDGAKVVGVPGQVRG